MFGYWCCDGKGKEIYFKETRGERKVVRCVGVNSKAGGKNV